MGKKEKIDEYYDESIDESIEEISKLIVNKIMPDLQEFMGTWKLDIKDIYNNHMEKVQKLYNSSKEMEIKLGNELKKQTKDFNQMGKSLINSITEGQNHINESIIKSNKSTQKDIGEIKRYFSSEFESYENKTIKKHDDLIKKIDSLNLFIKSQVENVQNQNESITWQIKINKILMIVFFIIIIGVEVGELILLFK